MTLKECLPRGPAARQALTIPPPAAASLVAVPTARRGVETGGIGSRRRALPFPLLAKEGVRGRFTMECSLYVNAYIRLPADDSLPRPFGEAILLLLPPFFHFHIPQFNPAHRGLISDFS